MARPIPSRRYAVLALSLLLAACRQDRLISDSGDGGFMIERDVGSAVEESFAGDRCARRERGGWHRSVGHCMEMTSSRRFTGVVVYAFEEMSFFPGATAIPDRNDLARYTTEIEISGDQLGRLLGGDLDKLRARPRRFRPSGDAVALTFIGGRTLYPYNVDCFGSRYYVYVPERVESIAYLGEIANPDPPPKPGEPRPPYKPFKPSGEGGVIGRLERDALERCAS